MKFIDATPGTFWQTDKGRVIHFVGLDGDQAILELQIEGEKKVVIRISAEQELNKIKQYRPNRAEGKIEGTRSKLIIEELKVGGTVEEIVQRIQTKTNEEVSKIKSQVMNKVSTYRKKGLLLEEEGKVRIK